MHSSTLEIQNLYRRFLKALFAVSTETVDDIRFNDALNTCHLNRFPNTLIQAWKDGFIMYNSTSANQPSQQIRHRLPGCNDPQSLFMLGEDCNTCMSIRSKQKGTNRGLLSFLIHGSCRLIGVRDENGALVSRAVVQLLIDDATYSPVLYMHGPQGDENNFAQV